MKSHYQICKKNLIKKDDSNLINEKLIEKKKEIFFNYIIVSKEIFN